MRRVDIGEDHRIPSTTEVLPALLSIYHENINKGLHTLIAGDVVHIEGYLVDVPSMGMLTGTRTNQHHEYVMSGQNPGMCFILFTTKLTVNGYTYQ